MSTSPAVLGGTTSPKGKAARDFSWLLRSELFVLREQWFWYLIQASFVPVSYLLFLWFLVGRGDPERMTYFVTGSLVMSLSFGGLISLGQHLGSLKAYNAFEYYASLPISKAIFIAAIATRGMLLSLPSTLVVLVLGNLAYDIPVSASGLVVLLLAAYAMVGFGAVIGFWSPSAEVASLATQVLQTVVIFFGPIYFPLDALPAPLRWLAHLWPTTYAAQALRGAVAGDPLSAIALPTLVLIGFIIVSLVLVPMKLDWRSR